MNNWHIKNEEIHNEAQNDEISSSDHFGHLEFIQEQYENIFSHSQQRIRDLEEKNDKLQCLLNELTSSLDDQEDETDNGESSSVNLPNDEQKGQYDDNREMISELNESHKFEIMNLKQIFYEMEQTIKSLTK